MCTGGDEVPGSVGEALRMVGAGLDCLNGPLASDLPAVGLGEVLVSLGELQAKFAAAHAALLARFDGADAHDSDGYGTPRSWLAAMTKMTFKDAGTAVQQMRLFAGTRAWPARWPPGSCLSRGRGRSRPGPGSCHRSCAARPTRSCWTRPPGVR